MNCSGNCSQSIEDNLSLETTLKHPCYSAGAHHKYARMHLPVAPKCNISCNYCNRKFDCVNESRPGVTSEILTPELALERFKVVKKKIENLSVVGIAGPGDALANWEQTRNSLELIKRADPELVFCLSTNGLMLPQLAREVVELGVNHVTVTLNTIDAEIGARIYRHINYQGKRYAGLEGAGILLENQLQGIELLTGLGVMVKVNIVMIKNLNDSRIPEVVKKAKDLGVFITNIMPLIPALGSVFANYPQTSTRELNKMRDICQLDLQQMRHCRQCRADAIGLLGEDRVAEFSSAWGQEGGADEITKPGRDYKIAIASKYGRMVDQHFGHAAYFTVYQSSGETFRLVEQRQVTQYCTGVDECAEDEEQRDEMIDAFRDCDAVVTMRIGYSAQKRLQNKGIVSIETCETVENALRQAMGVLSQQKDDSKEIA